MPDFARKVLEESSFSVFAAILIPLSFLVFAWALRRTKVTGTLTHI
jgi:hypothetical protein